MNLQSKTKQKYQCAHQVSWRHVDGETVLLDLGTSAYFSLNQTGSAVWALLSEGKSIDAIQSDICREYGAKPETVRKDVEALVRQLLNAGLIHPASG